MWAPLPVGGVGAGSSILPLGGVGAGSRVLPVGGVGAVRSTLPCLVVWALAGVSLLLGRVGAIACWWCGRRELFLAPRWCGGPTMPYASSLKPTFLAGTNWSLKFCQ